MHADLSIKRLLARLETLEAEVAVLRRENQGSSGDTHNRARQGLEHFKFAWLYCR